ncbi:heme oxygenase 1 [Neocloeon triangulifer]|uniref:heme oxygenase 1 n=1 Tax=Neocloeon triangulifer TaxID=2078957 RepID=UPI00286F0659|nr:heme oxygenase 1 [Neocloeon triangulifer]XP_059479565.1 heme oxygenase 1 [Neocloeon triangulifer]
MKTFIQEMREATRDVHDLSDKLVNAKLMFAMSDNSVWAEGLLIFYEIFKFLESAMTRMSNSLVGELDIEGLRRTEAFERDLTFYLGEDWKTNYHPRLEVAAYVKYLENLEETDPHLLMAYIYHLYMGLLSGGQILQKKRQLAQKFFPFFGVKNPTQTEGYAITNFQNKTIAQVKREFAKKMNEVANELDEVTKQKLIQESRTLFLKNNEIIKTVQGADNVFMKKTITLLGLSMVFVGIIWFALKQ